MWYNKIILLSDGWLSWTLFPVEYMPILLLDEGRDILNTIIQQLHWCQTRRHFSSPCPYSVSDGRLSSGWQYAQLPGQRLASWKSSSSCFRSYFTMIVRHFGISCACGSGTCSGLWWSCSFSRRTRNFSGCCCGPTPIFGLLSIDCYSGASFVGCDTGGLSLAWILGSGYLIYWILPMRRSIYLLLSNFVGGYCSLFRSHSMKPIIFCKIAQHLLCTISSPLYGIASSTDEFCYSAYIRSLPIST